MTTSNENQQGAFAGASGSVVRNCKTCAHRSGSMCVLTGYHWETQRRHPSTPCDIRLSGWQPIPAKKPLILRIREALGITPNDKIRDIENRFPKSGNRAIAATVAASAT